MERLMPFAVLLSIGAVLVVLFWRALRQSKRPQQYVVVPIMAAEPMPPPVVVVPTQKPLEEGSRLPVVAVEMDLPVVAPKKCKRASKALPASTPIHGVVKLLEDKDSLAMAFLLREILGPPVSKRV